MGWFTPKLQRYGVVYAEATDIWGGLRWSLPLLGAQADKRKTHREGGAQRLKGRVTEVCSHSQTKENVQSHLQNVFFFPPLPWCHCKRLCANSDRQTSSTVTGLTVIV